MVPLVEKLCDMLLDAVIELIKQNVIFKDTLKEVESKLVALKPIIQKMVQSNEELDRSKEELKGVQELLDSGIALIAKCSKIRVWKLWPRYKYGNKLNEWKKTLESQLTMLIPHILSDVKEIEISVMEIGIDAKETRSNVKEIAIDVKETRSDTKETVEILRSVKKSVMKIEEKVVVIPNQHAEATALLSTTTGVPELPEFIVGLEIHLKELKKKFLDDGVSMLVVTAAGGSGKTTLANMFYHDQQVKDKFKNIFYVTVSTTKSNEIVVHELCQQMGCHEAFQNEDHAFNWLQKFLKESGPKSFMLVLDDVWYTSESLLEKFTKISKRSNCNILVTSRFKFRSYGYPYPLVALNNDDAMTLFCHSAFRKDQTSCYVPQELQKKIVERCKGCPLVITVVGKSLCGKSLESWRKRVKEWSTGASIFDSETEVLIRLKSSLDALGEKDQHIKECFLDLGAFLEDQRIPATALIDMWSELYGLDEDFSVEQLQELSARSLARLVVIRKEKMEADGYYSEHFVSQHDMLRVLAIFEAKLDPEKKRLIIDKDNLSKFRTSKGDQPIKPHTLSISFDGEFPTNLHNVQLQEVEVLVLNFQTKNYALPEFVAEMKNLKVLIVTNHGFLHAELSNFELLNFLPHLKRIRLERISIPSIAKTSVALKSVMKISLFMCSICQAFSNSSFRISEAFPNLEVLNIDYCNDLVELPVDLCDLVQLNMLSVTHCHKLRALPEEIGKLIKLEVLRLKSCTGLETFPASITSLTKLNLLDISDCFSIKEFPDNFGELSTLEKINMRQCDRLQVLPASVCDLERLKEVICDEDIKGLWELVGLDINIRVLEEKFDLNWLQKFQS